MLVHKAGNIQKYFSDDDEWHGPISMFPLIWSDKLLVLGRLRTVTLLLQNWMVDCKAEAKSLLDCLFVVCQWK